VIERTLKIEQQKINITDSIHNASRIQKDPCFFLLVFILLSVYTFGKQRDLPFLEKDAIILGLCNICYKLRSLIFHNIRYKTKFIFEFKYLH